MSHFEYVSVSLALVNALAVGRLLSGLPPAMDRERRYWVHAVWVFALILVAALQWWGFWGWRNVAWTPIRFLSALSLPGLLFVQATVLVGETPGSATSFRNLFYDRRVTFFSLGMAAGVNIALGPWILGLVPWFSFGPVHAVGCSLMALSLAGLSFNSHNAQAIIASLSAFIVGASFFVINPVAPP